jgi:transposase
MNKRKGLAVKDICRVALDPSRSHREVSRLLGVSATTVAKYRNLMKLHQVDRNRLDGLTDLQIETLVQARFAGNPQQFFEPDWEHMSAELQRKGVTVALLYQEYAEMAAQQAHSAPLLSQSSFGRRLRTASKKHRLTMRQTHAPGEKMFVDFSGKHLFLTDPATRKKQPVEVFVSSLGASQLLFGTAVRSQKLPDWIAANVRALEFYGGVTACVVPDNLKSAVTKPKRSDRAPIINRTYLDFAEHYGVSIEPARSLHPQDKALAEIGVRIVNMWVIAALRDHVFYSLSEMNAEITKRIDQINKKVSRRLGMSRLDLFNETERMHLKPLPQERYQVVEWRDGILVSKDYHAPWKGDFYSVPYTLVGQRVNIAVSSTTLKAYVHYDLHPVAVHQLGDGSGKNITDRSHMPDAHRIYAAEQPEVLTEWAASIGKDVEKVFDAYLKNKRISPQSATRQMARVKQLARQYGQDRLRSACHYARSVGTFSADSIQSILKHGLDHRADASASQIVASPVAHKNVRGAASYGGEN